MKTKSKAKPYPDFPLTAHPSGQWCKKIRGKVHYFGVDATVALNKYLEERDALQAGKVPRKKTDGLTVRELVNRFLTSKKLKCNAGELSARMFGEYYDMAQTIVGLFGADRLVEDLAGDDFEQLRTRFAGLALVTVAKRVQIVRTIFRYAFDAELLVRPVRFGVGFDKPSRKNLRKAKTARGSKMIEAADVRRLLDSARQSMKAMILLALNCGLGNTDLGSLPQSALDLKRGWLDYPRQKTGVGRTCPLWPETVKAVREAIANRPVAKNPVDEALAFLTRCGQPWVRVKPKDNGTVVIADSVTLEFSKLLTALDLKTRGLSFYALRHVFRTVADASKDQPAVDHVMGHGSEDMASHYRERIDDDRLQAVVNVVHAWLWPVAKETPVPSILPFQATAG